MQLAMVLERLDQILRRVSQYSRSDKLVPDFMIDQIKNEIQPLNNSIEKLENKETDFLITKLLGEEVALGIDEINELVTKLDLVEQDITRTLG
jgi:tetrahydromethanopterin S-methyltransferase subunit B